MLTIPFSGSSIGLIVRGKVNESHEPNVLDQHADCILPNGSPIGFFGDEGAASSGSTSGSANSMGMNMKGLVADYEKMRVIRPYYVEIDKAKKYKQISTVLILPVTATEARLFGIIGLNLKYLLLLFIC